MKSILSSWIQRFHIIRHRRMVKIAVVNGLVLGNDVTIMDGVRFDHPHNALIRIDDNVVIGHDCRILVHDGTMYRKLGYGRMGSVHIKKDSVIAERTLILPGVTIGEKVHIGAGSVVTRDVPDNSLAIGHPAKVICSLDDYLERQQTKINASKVFDHKEFYENVKSAFQSLECTKSKKLFYTKGQNSKKIWSTYRFNITLTLT